MWEFAQKVLSEQGVLGLVVMSLGVVVVWQYRENRSLYQQLIERADDVNARAEKRLEQMNAVLADNVESNRAVTKALEDGRRFAEVALSRRRNG